MKEINSEVLIIGAGLTGLSLAYFLKSNQINTTLIEARSRLGGRIYTEQSLGTPPVELGATWLSNEHTSTLELIEALGLGVFDQAMGSHAIYEAFSTAPFQTIELPVQGETSKRITGGTQKLIEALANQIDSANIHFNEPVNSITKTGDILTVETDSTPYKGRIVVSTLPPLLFQTQILTKPELPIEFIEIASQTHTWMGESIKVSFSYEKKFWGRGGIGGTIFSNVGPISEMYDQSDAENKSFALTGFFSGAYYSVSPEERKKMALNQLRKYFGEQADQFISYEEMVWKNEVFTTANPTTSIFPHQNNGHQVYQKGYLDNSLFIAGTETSLAFGGYMEGAIRSAQKIASILLRDKK